MDKFFAYLRVSSKGQINNDGFPRQRETIFHYAAANRLEPAGEFRDEGISGATDGFDRPGMSDLFVAIRSNGVRTVIVERSDRLARDLIIGEIILAEFRKLGVRVIAADAGVDLTADNADPTAILIRQILGAVSQFDKSHLVMKLKAARIRVRRATGRCEGRKPYGEKLGEAEVVARIRVLARKPRQGKRRSIRAIAAALNAEGIQTRYGRNWGPAQVHGILGRLRA